MRRDVAGTHGGDDREVFKIIENRQPFSYPGKKHGQPQPGEQQRPGLQIPPVEPGGSPAPGLPQAEEQNQGCGGGEGGCGREPASQQVDQPQVADQPKA